MYTQTFPDNIEAWFTMLFITHSDQDANTAITAGFKAFAFADRFLAPAFFRATNELLVGVLLPHCCTSANAISYACENMPAGHPFIQALVDGYCQEWDGEEFCCSYGEMQKLPFSFLRRVVARLSELKETSSKKKKEKRCYWVHDGDEEKNACGALHMCYDEALDLATFK
jgi:hypothetical protein